MLISLTGPKAPPLLTISTAIVTLLWINIEYLQCRAQTSFCSAARAEIRSTEAQLFSPDRGEGPVIITRSWCGIYFDGFRSDHNESSPHAMQTNWRSFAPKCPQAQVSLALAAAGDPSFEVPQADSWPHQIGRRSFTMSPCQKSPTHCPSNTRVSG
jgi:hypothetical protein